ncbi:hypothetical protein PHLGIDRAFT_119958 [Phlebiopsis gigantea 11061_1 CR5-6]|uniref:Uncharacterized protein n=1 Tax=Phlebiopsis gigantea (strain 11061_1 CR5-6) TaxID=745531 RepID=A0A0C3NK48_PHLG1|nr:hypothetical protein PHLGIDRAFT_119958 [Phlebiopsis gigantea 11061_1 CR5-6]
MRNGSQREENTARAEIEPSSRPSERRTPPCAPQVADAAPQETMYLKTPQAAKKALSSVQAELDAVRVKVDIANARNEAVQQGVLEAMEARVGLSRIASSDLPPTHGASSDPLPTHAAPFNLPRRSRRRRLRLPTSLLSSLESNHSVARAANADKEWPALQADNVTLRSEKEALFEEHAARRADLETARTERKKSVADAERSVVAGEYRVAIEAERVDTLQASRRSALDARPPRGHSRLHGVCRVDNRPRCATRQPKKKGLVTQNAALESTTDATRAERAALVDEIEASRAETEAPARPAALLEETQRLRRDNDRLTLDLAHAQQLDARWASLGSQGKGEGNPQRGQVKALQEEVAVPRKVLEMRREDIKLRQESAELYERSLGLHEEGREGFPVETPFAVSEYTCEN